MAAVSFEETAAAGLYVAKCAGAAADAQCLLVLPAATGQSSVDFDTAWRQAPYSGGCFAFVDQPVPPADLDAFAGAMRDYLHDAARAGARFAWIANAADAGTEPLRGPCLCLDPVSADGTALVSTPLSLDLRNLSLVVAKGCPVTAATDAWQVAPADSGSLSLSANWGATPVGAVGTAGLSLPACGAQAGCVTFPMTLDTSTDLDILDVGLRLFYPYAEAPQDAGASSDARWLQSLRFPLLQPTAGSLSVAASIDPNAPGDHQRTQLALVGAGSLPTHLRTRLGASLDLVPGADAALVLAARPYATTPSSADPFYLVPAGSFGVAAAAGVADGDSGARDVSVPSSVMCGLSPVEYIVAAPGTNVVFQPDQPAYAAGFVPDDAQQPAELRPAATTSWVWSNAAQDVVYAAQPQQSVMHTPQKAGEKFLDYYEVQAASLSGPANASRCFPMLPWGGVAVSDAKLAGQLERQVVAPARRERIFTATSAAAASADRAVPAAFTPAWTTTPLGLAAHVSSATAWDRVLLAQDVKGAQVTLAGVTDTADAPLLSALTSTQLFMVVSDMEKLAPFLGISVVSLWGDGNRNPAQCWSFRLSPVEPGHPPPMLVFKLCPGRLVDLAANTAAWTQGSAFNGDPAAASRALLALLDAKLPDPAFVQAISDERWRGILAFQLPVETLPQGLAGLAAGIRKEAFNAHHIGFNLTPVTLTDPNQQPVLQTTSIFGLVDYHADAPLQNNGFPYNFQVESLTAVFQNSAITSFSSDVQLQINELFGAASTAPPNNIIDLHGVVQADGYTFTLVEPVTYSLPGTALQGVAVSKAQFVTVSSDAQSVHSRFVLWGTMQFAALSSAGVTFDLFSYGPDTGSPGGGLVISGLHIDMMSGQLGEPDPVTYGFDASAVTFDEATSHVRSGGLINHFPLTLKRLLQAGGNDTPASLHWMSVTTPIGQGPFAWPWFGLQFDLDLGSFGALAGDVGFTVGLLLAWAPRGTSDSVFVGLTMPGAVGGNKRQIGLEGVLALTFGSLDLALPAAPPDVQPPPGYVLTLRNIQLSLLSVGFPRTGQTNVYVFGDPSGGSDPALGWYAAYGTGTSTQSGAAAVLVPDLVAPARLAALGRRR